MNEKNHEEIKDMEDFRKKFSEIVNELNELCENMESNVSSTKVNEIRKKASDLCDGMLTTDEKEMLDEVKEKNVKHQVVIYDYITKDDVVDKLMKNFKRDKLTVCYCKNCRNLFPIPKEKYEEAKKDAEKSAWKPEIEWCCPICKEGCGQHISEIFENDGKSIVSKYDFDFNEALDCIELINLLGFRFRSIAHLIYKEAKQFAKEGHDGYLGYMHGFYSCSMDVRDSLHQTIFDDIGVHNRRIFFCRQCGMLHFKFKGEPIEGNRYLVKSGSIFEVPYAEIFDEEMENKICPYCESDNVERISYTNTAQRTYFRNQLIMMKFFDHTYNNFVRFVIKNKRLAIEKANIKVNVQQEENE